MRAFDRGGDFFLFIAVISQCALFFLNALFAFPLEPFQAGPAGFEPLPGGLGSISFQFQQSEFGLTEAKPVNQGDVTGTDKVTASALNTVGEAEIPGVIPQSATDGPVQSLGQQQGRTDAGALAASDAGHFGLWRPDIVPGQYENTIGSLDNGIPVG